MKYLIRLVEEEDASFIVGLRNNPKLNRYVSQVSANVEDQINWIRNYKIKEKNNKEFYFIIYENGSRKGLFRLYNINSVSFTTGSWLFDVCENKNLPILTELVLSDIGFYELNKHILLYDCRKGNKKVIQFNYLKNPLWYNEDEQNNYYLLTVDNWEEAKNNVMSFFGITDMDYKEFRSIYKFGYNMDMQILGL